MPDAHGSTSTNGRTVNGTVASGSAEESTTNGANGSHSAERDEREVGDALMAVSKEIHREDSSGEEDGGGSDVPRLFKRMKVIQEHLIEVGELVGAKGKPGQIVQDALLTRHANSLIIPAIRSIRITRSVWIAKLFTKQLLKQLSRHCVTQDEEDESDDRQAKAISWTDSATATMFYGAFIDEYLGECPAGLGPDLSTVYGAVAAALPPKVKALKSALAADDGIVTKSKQRDLPKVVRRLQAAEMDANIVRMGTRLSELSKLDIFLVCDVEVKICQQDPTMQRVGDLNGTIQDMYKQHDKKPICLMRLLIDRESFQNTVQNFFCFSFLLKDNTVRMFLDEAKLPVCVPSKIVKERQTDTSMSEEYDDVEMEDVPDHTVHGVGEDKYQAIMLNLTEKSWKDLVVTFYPSEAGSE